MREQRSTAMRDTKTLDPDGREEEWAKLHVEIARLPGRYRELIVICYFEGMTSEAAATRLGCPREPSYHDSPGLGSDCTDGSVNGA
jgi:DNA-directed RNA polymerase specialized sigma24 family protein